MAITLTRHVAAGLALTLVATLLVTAAPADAAKCTKRGSNGDDILKGTKKTDVLCGRGGNDVLIAKRRQGQPARRRRGRHARTAAAGTTS